ncbi:hypothetical protein BKA65DRAFT_594168 [Rhexocercosporidium sp. MPI-PUGE-AT-0058]|nr:hypothetical protein BKA65DRAFT_594168 [Rhexocercosporidium sp. MPI-PUGE-AT-0058]
MPGVPSSRGCDACRKQKKKCDQSKPACSRCARLKINCIGSGQQRYKFKNQTTALDVVKVQPAPVALPPTNGDTLLLSDFISTLGVIDVRYDLTYYGGFLSDLPRRLGTNDALDASVGALAAAYPYVHTKRLSPDMLSKYGHALKTLRIYLSDPKRAYTPDTLCAIYLMDVCQSWIGRREDLLKSHGEIMAHFLNAAPVDKWRDSFEIEMLITISAAVAMESFANSRIQLDEFFAKLDDAYRKPFGPKKYFDKDAPLSITLPSLANMGKYFRDPELYIVEIAAMYQEALMDYNTARQRLTVSAETLAVARTPLESYPVTKRYTAVQAAVGLIGSIVLNLGSILRIFSPDDVALSADAARFSSEMILLSESAMQYRPLGSCYMPFCLVSAWAATDGTAEQAEIERMLEEWQNDFQETRWMNMANWLKSGLEDLRLRLTLSQLRVSPAHTVTGIQDARMGGPNACCVQ